VNIKARNPDFDCCGGACDCERIKVVVAAALALLALYFVVRTRNKAAMKEAIELIARAKRSAQDVGRIEIIRAEARLAEVETANASLDVQMQEVLDVMRALEETAFTGAAGTVRIIP